MVTYPPACQAVKSPNGNLGMPEYEDRSELLHKRADPCVYIYRDADGMALYVGMTDDIVTRARSHRRLRRGPLERQWFNDAHSLSVARVATRQIAADEEARLIHKFHPPGNAFCPACKFYNGPIVLPDPPGDFSKWQKTFRAARLSSLSIWQSDGLGTADPYPSKGSYLDQRQCPYVLRDGALPALRLPLASRPPRYVLPQFPKLACL